MIRILPEGPSLGVKFIVTWISFTRKSNTVNLDTDKFLINSSFSLSNSRGTQYLETTMNSRSFHL